MVKEFVADVVEPIRREVHRRLGTRNDRVLLWNFHPFVSEEPEGEFPSIAGWFAGVEATADCQALDALFRKFGSDKSTRHDYFIAYAGLLAARREEPLRILEIGVGTNNPDVPSSMGATGSPGASLRAWREWGRLFEIHGADVDRNILFSEERINCHWVDQTDPRSFSALRALGPGTFDVVIDDGLHRPDANINTLAFALDMIRPDGIVVIEDIPKSLMPFWESIAQLLSGYEVRCLLGRSEGIAVVQRKDQV